MDERRTGGESLDGTRGVVVPDTGGVSTGAEIHLPQPHMRSTAMTATLASPRRLISALLAAALAATIGSVRPAVASPASPKAGPTNGRIVFVSGRTGNADIWSVNPDGTGLVNLTNDMGDDSEPAVSADGTRIAWISDRDQGNRDVYVMNADGTDVQRLTTDPEMESWPSFSPDGTRIVFGSNLDIFNDTDPQIYVMGVDRSNLTRLTTDGSWDDQARFSPDGSKIVFTSRRDGDPEIYMMNPNGSNQTDATNDHAFRDEYPWWSPDGSQLVFTSNRSAAAGPVAPADSPLPDDRVWVMPFPGGPAAPFSLAAGNQPSWAAVPQILDLTLAQPPSVGPVATGTKHRLGYHVANVGNLDAANVTIQATLPHLLAFVSARRCTAEGRVVTCQLGTITPGDSDTVKFRVRVRRFPQSLSERTANVLVTVSSTGTDAHPDDNSRVQQVVAVHA